LNGLRERLVFRPAMLITANLLVALSALMLATSFLSGIFGMAGGMILMGALLAFLPVPAAMVLHAVAQMTSNGWRAVLWARYVDWRIFGRYLLGLALAFAAFSWVRLVPDRALVFIVLGAIPFIAATIPDRLAPRADRRGGAESAGLLGTALQLICGVSGPTLDVFFVRTLMDRRAVVATKAACQVVTHLAKLIYFSGLASVAGDLDQTILALSVVMAIIGTSLARTVLERLTDVQFRWWTQRIVMAMGAVYIVQGVWLYLQG
jgi:uncharacterized membrane protein YfcA